MAIDCRIKKGQESLDKQNKKTISSHITESVGMTATLSSATNYWKNVFKSKKASKEYILEHDGDVKSLKSLAKKMGDTTADVDMKLVNPRKNGNVKGTYENCVGCSVAMDMRKRGYDVRARLSNQGLTSSEIVQIYDGGKLQKVDTTSWKRKESFEDYMARAVNEIGTSLESQGPNTRGLIAVGYEGGFGGHVMYWENNERGKATVYDGQNNKKNPNSVFAMCDPEAVYVMRTDNLELSENASKYVTDKM